MTNRVSSVQALKSQMSLEKYKPQAREDILTKMIEEMKQDPKYADWSELQIQDYAATSIMAMNAATRQRHTQGILALTDKPDDRIWSQFTYEEILQMEDDGIVIPEEFLEWAHSMEDTDVSNYELTEESSADETSVESVKAEVGGGGQVAEQRSAKALSKKVLMQEDTIKQTQQEFEQYSTQIETMTSEVQLSQTQSLQKVQSMLTEWQALDDKAKNGEQLKPDELVKYGELGAMMNNEVVASTVQITGFTADFDEISNMMKTASTESQKAQDFALEASFMARLVAPEENKHNFKSISSNAGFSGSFGLIDILKSAAIGQNAALNTIKKGNDLRGEAFNSDKAIKEMSEQMKSMTESVNTENASISRSANLAQSNKSEQNKPEVGDVKEQNQPQPPENLESLPVNKSKENSENSEDNVFAQEEDFNDINLLLKKEQQKAPEPEIDNVITS